MSPLLYITIIVAGCVVGSLQDAGLRAVTRCSRSSTPLPDKVSVQNCGENEEVCNLKIGSVLNGVVEFQTRNAVKSPQYEVWGYKYLIWIKAYAADINVCETVGLPLQNTTKCSLDGGKHYTAILKTDIPDSVSGSLYIQMSLFDTISKIEEYCFGMYLYLT